VSVTVYPNDDERTEEVEADRRDNEEIHGGKSPARKLAAVFFRNRFQLPVLLTRPRRKPNRRTISASAMPFTAQRTMTSCGTYRNI
jgi:hypothetical protein